MPPSGDPPGARPRPRRGAAENPQGRFERLRVDAGAEFAQPDPEAPDADELPSPETRWSPDPSRSALSYNDSPDLPFSASLNPYRGCEHGCSYCLAPEARILHADMVWRPIGDVRVGDRLVGFDEYNEAGRTRKFRAARVLAKWWSRRPTLRLFTPRAELVTTAEHRWLQARDFRWSATARLAPGDRLRHLAAPDSEPFDEDYRAGYVAGVSLGDGTFRYRPGWRSARLGYPAAYWRVAMKHREPLERLVEFTRCFGVPLAIRPFDAGPRTATPMWKVETRSLTRLDLLAKLTSVERSSASYRRGFVAGFFDAEGHAGRSLRISQVELDTLERVGRYAGSLGFEFRLEVRKDRASTIRLVGSVSERLRFFSVFRPAIARRLESIFGTTPAWEPEPIAAIEAGPARDVVDIQTSTGTFLAEGLATHNCYARPTHEYLGLSAGLDFETRILVKQELPALLRRELASPRWRPQTIALSGVTDAYQPLERKLQVTRRCLEVLVEFRNPVAVVTKSALVARDADLLRALARVDAASAYVSITTLDPELARRMEPRAAAPGKRLAAIEALACAGVPVGVMVAPLVPGLNDHELPAILEAAARAGARFAGRVMLRLPHGLGELFGAWLERHYPERRAKVLGLVRAMRGGRLYDARFHERQLGRGPLAEQTHALFALACRRAGLGAAPALSTAAFRRAGAAQLALFDAGG